MVSKCRKNFSDQSWQRNILKMNSPRCKNLKQFKHKKKLELQKVQLSWGRGREIKTFPIC